MQRLLLASLALIAPSLAACAPSGYAYEVGNFVRPHPTQATCASRGQVLDMTIEDCVNPAPSQPVIAAAAYGDQGETYESDRAWTERLKNGECSRLRYRDTDAPQTLLSVMTATRCNPLA
jgi:hypothetical protein